MHQRTIVAGTLDRLHAGHFAMLHLGFAFGNRVEIWIVDDALCSAKASRLGQTIQPLRTRCEAVSAWCDEETPDDIAAFSERYGLALQPSQAGAGSIGDPAIPPDPTHPYRGRYSLHELRDLFGDSIRDPSYTAIVCSEETVPGCAAINERRSALGWPPLEVIVAPLLRDEHGEKLSSTAIRAALHQGRR